jgi:hypothetical protein
MLNSFLTGLKKKPVALLLQLAILITYQDPLALRRIIADALLVHNVAYAR